MTGDAVVNAAVKVHNSARELGVGYKELQSALVEYRKEAFREGGQAAVEDFANQAGPSRVDTDLIGLLIACGLGNVLVAAAGRADQRPNPNFGLRYAQLARSGSLETKRGQPIADPASAHESVRARSPQPRREVRP